MCSYETDMLSSLESDTLSRHVFKNITVRGSPVQGTRCSLTMLASE